MNTLTDQQKNELKSLPGWFIQRLKNSILEKKEYESKIELEQKRFEEFKQDVITWKAKQDELYITTMDKLEQRLREAEEELNNQNGLSSSGSTLPNQNAIFDKMLSHRYKSLELTDETLEKVKESNLKLENELKSILERINKKEKQIENWETHSQFSRNRSMTFVGDDIDIDFESINSPRDPIPISEIEIQEVPINVFLESLLELILDKEYRLINALLHSLKASELEQIAQDIVRIFDSTKELFPLLEKVIEKEVQNTIDINTLFRSNSVASRIMSTYSRLVAKDYLRNTFKPVIDEIVINNLNLEIDGLKLMDDKVEAQRTSIIIPSLKINDNIEKLKSLAKEIIQTLLQTRDAIPHEINIIAAIIKEKVQAKFSDEWKIAIGGYLFLRIYCPIIFLPPEDFNCNLDHTKTDAKRSLVLLSKVLQSIANLRSISTDTIMEPFNEFVKKNIPIIETYFESVSTRPAEYESTKIPEYPLRSLIENVMNALVSVGPKVISQLKSLPSNLIIQQWTFTKASKLVNIHNSIKALQQDGEDTFTQIQSILNDLTNDKLICKAIIETIITMRFTSSELEEIASTIFLLYHTQGNGYSLFEKAVQIELELNNPTAISFPDSLPGKLFCMYAKLTCRSVTKLAFGHHVFNLAKSVEMLLDSSVLVDIGNSFLIGVAASLQYLPTCIWKICSLIYKHERLGIQYVLHLLMCELYCRSLEDPEAYSIPTGGGDRLVKKGLFTISEILKNIVNGVRDDINKEIDQFMQKGRKLFQDSVEKWLENPSNVEDNDVYIDQKEIRDAVGFLSVFLSKNISKISLSLQKNGEKKAYVCFSLIEFVEMLMKINSDNKKNN